MPGAIPFTALSVVVLFNADRVLLLRRAASKAFAPNRWTGIGGKVELGEWGDVVAAARRELFEETDLAPAEVSELTFRRSLTFFHPAEGLVCLLYFTGRAATDRIPACSEGELAWVSPTDFAGLDVIENTAAVLDLLIGDERQQPLGVRCGVAVFDRRGRLLRVRFD